MRGDGTLQVGPVGRQDHQIVDLGEGTGGRTRQVPFFQFDTLQQLSLISEATPRLFLPSVVVVSWKAARSGDPALLLQKR